MVHLNTVGLGAVFALTASAAALPGKFHAYPTSFPAPTGLPPYPTGHPTGIFPTATGLFPTAPTTICDEAEETFAAQYKRFEGARKLNAREWQWKPYKGLHPTGTAASTGFAGPTPTGTVSVSVSVSVGFGGPTGIPYDY